MGLGSWLPLNFLSGFLWDVLTSTIGNIIDIVNYGYWDFFPIVMFR